MKLLKSTLAIVTAAAVLGVSGFAQAGATLDAVQKKGFVQCGVGDGLPGFSVPDSTGKIVGIDADFCRCLLYTSPSPRDRTRSRMPSSA